MGKEEEEKRGRKLPQEEEQQRRSRSTPALAGVGGWREGKDGRFPGTAPTAAAARFTCPSRLPSPGGTSRRSAGRDAGVQKFRAMEKTKVGASETRRRRQQQLGAAPPPCKKRGGKHGVLEGEGRTKGIHAADFSFPLLLLSLFLSPASPPPPNWQQL